MTDVAIASITSKEKTTVVKKRKVIKKPNIQFRVSQFSYSWKDSKAAATLLDKDDR